jgi:hypothetical protein
MDLESLARREIDSLTSHSLIDSDVSLSILSHVYGCMFIEREKGASFQQLGASFS